jgi:hypothetical protein
MSRLRLPRARAATAVLVALLATTTGGCGDTSDTGAKDAAATDVAAASAGHGDWLLRFTTAGGEDGERMRAVYVRYNPTTGAAEARALPAVIGSDASPDEQVLLVNADHTWAIPDTGVPRAQRSSGKLVLYAVDSNATDTLDIRAATDSPDLRPVAWAFDPTDPDVLRVVDAEHLVWRVDLAAKSATQEDSLPQREGWIFANGFDKNSGKPYIESIDSDQTDPAGNGDNDTRPVERQGGTLVRYVGEPLDDLPKPPCDFAGGFRFGSGTAWLFCADTPSVSAYQAHVNGASWHQFGTASPKIVPEAAVELTFVLPPVG